MEEYRYTVCSLVGFSQPKPASQQCFSLTKNQHQPVQTSTSTNQRTWPYTTLQDLRNSPKPGDSLSGGDGGVHAGGDITSLAGQTLWRAEVSAQLQDKCGKQSITVHELQLVPDDTFTEHGAYMMTAWHSRTGVLQLQR